jgi:hypothetical protein
VPNELTAWLLQAFGVLRAAVENVALRQELSLARQRRRRVVADAERRARLALSAGASRPNEEGNPSELLDRLARGIGQLKTLADRSLTAMQQDVQRRRVAYFTQQHNARRARRG